jgi:hypothetical protein
MYLTFFIMPFLNGMLAIYPDGPDCRRLWIHTYIQEGLVTVIMRIILYIILTHVLDFNIVHVTCYSTVALCYKILQNASLVHDTH